MSKTDVNITIDLSYNVNSGLEPAEEGRAARTSSQPPPGDLITMAARNLQQIVQVNIYQPSGHLQIDSDRVHDVGSRSRSRSRHG